MLFPVLEQTINVSIALVTKGAIVGSAAWLAWRKLVTFPTQRTPCGFILSLSLQARTPTSRRRARREGGKRSELALCSIRCQLSLEEEWKVQIGDGFSKVQCQDTGILYQLIFYTYNPGTTVKQHEYVFKSFLHVSSSELYFTEFCNLFCMQTYVR